MTTRAINGLPLGQIRTVEGTQTFLIDSRGQAVMVTPGEVQGLLQRGYQVPNADQQAWTQNALAGRNPDFYQRYDAQGHLVAQGTSGGAASATPSTPAAAPRDYRTEAGLLFPWIPSPLLDVFATAWQQYGDPNLALQTVRQSANYETYFAGNRRDDGSVRLAEAEYLSTIEGYNRELRALGLDPGRFAGRLPQAIQNGKSVDEFTDDITAVSAGVLSRGDNVRNFYATNYGTGDLSDAALVDSVLTGDSPAVYERHIRSAQIGGEAAGYGFSLARTQAERLDMLGLDQQAARGLFAKAQGELPTLNELVARHNDPADPFTLDDYSNAIVLQSPAELGRIRRLYGQEQSMFSAGGLLATSQAGGERGLLAR